MKSNNEELENIKWGGFLNEFVDLTLPLQPVFHRLLKGHQLRLVICGTDYEMTLRGNEKINYQIMTENSALFLPDFEKL